MRVRPGPAMFWAKNKPIILNHLKCTPEVPSTAAVGYSLHVRDTPTHTHIHTRTHAHAHARTRSESTLASLFLDLHFQSLAPNKVCQIKSEWKWVTFAIVSFTTPNIKAGGSEQTGVWRSEVRTTQPRLLSTASWRDSALKQQTPH